MAPRKVGPHRKVGPARIAKTKHKFAKSKVRILFTIEYNFSLCCFSTQKPRLSLKVL